MPVAIRMVEVMALGGTPRCHPVPESRNELGHALQVVLTRDAKFRFPGLTQGSSKTRVDKKKIGV